VGYLPAAPDLRHVSQRQASRLDQLAERYGLDVWENLAFEVAEVRQLPIGPLPIPNFCFATSVGQSSLNAGFAAVCRIMPGGLEVLELGQPGARETRLELLLLVVR
jgi:hypothetical protein